MCKCRTSKPGKPGFSTSPEFFDEPLSDKYIAERVEDFYTWAKPDSLETRTIFMCAIEKMMDDADDWKTCWAAMSTQMDAGLLSTLKKHMDEYVKVTVENGEADWS